MADSTPVNVWTEENGDHEEVVPPVVFDDLKGDVVKRICGYLDLCQRAYYERVSQKMGASCDYWWVRQKCCGKHLKGPLYTKACLKSPNLAEFFPTVAGIDDSNQREQLIVALSLAKHCPSIKHFTANDRCLSLVSSYLSQLRRSNQVKSLWLSLNSKQPRLVASLKTVMDMCIHLESLLLVVTDPQLIHLFWRKNCFQRVSPRLKRFVGNSILYEMMDLGTNLEELDVCHETGGVGNCLHTGHIRQLPVKHPNIKILRSGIPCMKGALEDLSHLQNLQTLYLAFPQNDLPAFFKYLSLRGQNLRDMRLQFTRGNIRGMWRYIESCCPNLERLEVNTQISEGSDAELTHCLVSQRKLKSLLLNQVVHQGLRREEINSILENNPRLRFFFFWPAVLIPPAPNSSPNAEPKWHENQPAFQIFLDTIKGYHESHPKRKIGHNTQIIQNSSMIPGEACIRLDRL